MSAPLQKEDRPSEDGPPPTRSDDDALSPPTVPPIRPGSGGLLSTSDSPPTLSLSEQQDRNCADQASEGKRPLDAIASMEAFLGIGAQSSMVGD